MSDSEIRLEFVGKLGEEFVERFRQGERPSVKEYTNKYPEYRAEIEEFFPTLMVMEDLAPGMSESLAGESPMSAARGSLEFDQLGDYRILREIGRGGMGIVYEAEQVSLGRHVALKVLPTELLKNTRLRLRFEREARAAAKLHHTNIVPVFGIGCAENQAYYVMQFIQGQSLDTVLRELQRLNAADGGASPMVDPTQLQGTLVPSEDPSNASQDRAAHCAQMLMTGTYCASDESLFSMSLPNGDASLAATMHRSQQANATLDRSIHAHRTEANSKSLGAPSTTLSETHKLSGSSVILSGKSAEKLGAPASKSTYWQSVARIGTQVAEALDYAHGQNILHRDIKPANLLLDLKGTVWITDFGLARVDNECDLTRTGDILGTLRYLAPEVFRGHADARSEVYALGLTLYELLALRPAFDESQRSALIDQVMRSEIKPLGNVNREIPSDLQTVIHKALARDPQDRYQTAGEFADDLCRFIDDEPIKARQVSTVERLARWSRHNRGLSASLAAVAILVSVLAIGSTIAANYFRWLNRDLILINKELTVARNSAQGQAQENLKLAKSNDAARIEAIQAAEREQSLTKEANKTRLEVESQHEINRRNLYSAQMQLAHQAWGLVKGSPRMKSLLDQWLPDPEKNDLRGWEWYYLKSLEHTEAYVIDGHHDYVRCCAFSPDGRFLATGGHDKTIRISDARTGRLVQILQGHGATVVAVDWHPDGSRLASSSDDSTVRIWNARSGETIRTLVDQNVRFTSVDWSQNGKWLAAGSPAYVRVWDTQAWNSIGEANVPAEVVEWMPDDGDQLVLQGQGVTGVWSPLSSQPPRSLFSDKDQWRPAIAISPDGQLIATPNQSDIHVRNAKTGELIKTLRGHKLPALSLSFSPDGRQLASGGGEFIVTLWDLEAGVEANVFRGQSNDISCVRWHPDGKHVASTSNDARVWSTLRSNGDLEVKTSNTRAYRLAWSPDGQRIATAGQGGNIEIYDSDSGQLLTSMPGHEFWIEGVSWNSHRPMIATAGRDDRVRIWNPDTGEKLHEISNLRRVTSVEFSPDGERLAICGQMTDEQVIVLDCSSWQVVGSYTSSNAPVSSVNWDCDGSRIAGACTDQWIYVWDTRTSKQLAKIPGYSSVVWSSKGDRLVTSPGVLEVWETKNWTRVATLEGHTSLIYSMSWNADDTRLISSSHDSTFIIWDTTNYTQLLTMRQGRDQVHCAAWDPDSCRIAAVDSKGYLHVVDAREGMSREHSPQYLSYVNRRLATHGDDVELLHWKWQDSVQRRASDAESDRVRLIAACQRRMADGDTSETTSRLLAAGLVADSSGWTPLEPIEMTSTTGVKFTRDKENTISVTNGPLKTGSYTIRGKSPVRRLSSLRLDAIPSRNLPGGGSGWGGGNFRLSELKLSIKRKDGSLVPVTFTRAGASVANVSPQVTIDERDDRAWDVWPAQTNQHWLVLGLDESIELNADDQLVVQLQFNDPQWLDAKLGCFQLLVSPAPDAFTRQLLAGLSQSEHADRYSALAAALLFANEPRRALETLELNPSDSPSHEATRLMLTTLAQHQLGQLDSAQATCRSFVQRLQNSSFDSEWRPLAVEILTRVGGQRLKQAQMLVEQTSLFQDLLQLTRAVNANSGSPEPYSARAKFFRQLGRWKDAAADSLRFVSMEHGERNRWFDAAACLVLAGEIEQYRQACPRMIAQFQYSENTGQADVICKSCLLVPDSVDLHLLPIQAVRAGALNRNEEFREWFMACSALFAYRSGSPGEAIEWINGMPDLSRDSGLFAQLIRAMAEQKLGLHKQAALTLMQAEQRIPWELETLGTEEFTGTLPVSENILNHDWMTVEILRREASQLIRNTTRRQAVPQK